MPHRALLNDLGWRQGAMLTPGIDARLTAGAHYRIPEKACLVVVSQTCDLIQGDMDLEPYFEVLCLSPLGREPEGEYANGKNSRRIEFSYTIEGLASPNWRAFPYERHLVDRQMLLNHSPAGFIGDQHVLAMILSWLARRYTRTAFPDAFVGQINHKNRRSPISKKFARLNSFIANVYIRMSPFGEISGEESYDVEMILVMDSKKFDDLTQYNECLEVKNQLEKQLNKCDKIEVTDINIESSAALSFDDVKGFRAWDYSYLSFREPGEAVMPLDGPVVV